LIYAAPDLGRPHGLYPLDRGAQIFRVKRIYSKVKLQYCISLSQDKEKNA